jgi:hypothetical protein
LAAIAISGIASVCACSAGSFAKFLSGLCRAFAAGASAFGRWLRPLYAREWVVYAKPPFGGPAVVLKYLARYTHRVAISNRRLVSWVGDVVTFTGKDYANGGRTRPRTHRKPDSVPRFVLLGANDRI